MNLLFSLGFVVAGVACLWAAFTGKTLYYGQLGAIEKKPSEPMSPEHARFVYIVMGLGFLFTGIGSFVQQTFGWPPVRHH